MNFENRTNANLVGMLTVAITKKMAAQNAIKSGKTVKVYFEDKLPFFKRLVRWGGSFEVTIQNGKIIHNSLTERAWNYDPTNAFHEANHAILFFARQWQNNKNSIRCRWEIS